MAGLTSVASLKPPVLLGALAAWTLVPLATAALAFSRREL